MLTLFVSGPRLGLPDASPFVIKALVLLKMSGLPFQTAHANFAKAPKGKIPYLKDGELLLGDSTFIRFYLEDRYGVDFDKHLSHEEKGISWAFEKMVENELYWAVVRARWLNEDNFNKGPRSFFDDAPAVLRPLIRIMVKRSVRTALHGQGIGRHTEQETELLAARDLEAISAKLGSKPWLMGATPCAADAAVWAFVGSCLCPAFETPIRTSAESLTNLVDYRDRGTALWFPELVASASD